MGGVECVATMRMHGKDKGKEREKRKEKQRKEKQRKEVRERKKSIQEESKE